MCTSKYASQRNLLEIELATAHRHPGYDVPHIFNLEKCCDCCAIDRRETCLDLWEEMYYQTSNDRNPRKSEGITPELYQKVIDGIHEFYKTHSVTEHYIPEEMDYFNLKVLGGRFFESLN